MEGSIESSKQAVVASRDRLLKSLSFVPDDRLNWQPSPTAKSALQIAAHCAASNRIFEALIAGKEIPFQSFPELFARIDAEAGKLTSRNQVTVALEDSTAAVIKALDGLTPERIASEVGPFRTPMPSIMQLAATHTHNHTGQIDYLQTVWGDTDPHM